MNKEKIIMAIVLCVGAIAIFQKISSKPVNGSHKVILYTTNTCPYSKKAKRELKKANVAYTECNISESKSCAWSYKQAGYKRVPVLLIDNRVVQNYSKENVLRELGVNS